MADDVGSAEGVRGNETVVLVGSGPADSIIRSTVGDTARVLGAVNDNSGDVTMGLDGRGHGQDGESSGKHVESCE